MQPGAPEILSSNQAGPTGQASAATRRTGEAAMVYQLVPIGIPLLPGPCRCGCLVFIKFRNEPEFVKSGGRKGRKEHPRGKAGLSRGDPGADLSF